MPDGSEPLRPLPFGQGTSLCPSAPADRRGLLAAGAARRAKGEKGLRFWIQNVIEWSSVTFGGKEKVWKGNERRENSEAAQSGRAWAYVLIGGALEIVWASGFKYDAVPDLIVIISLLVSFDLIIRATKVLPVGTTYAVFTAIGTVGTVVVEAVAEGRIGPLKVILLLLLLLCIVGLKVTEGEGGR